MKRFLLLLLALFISGIKSNLDEDRLLKHLFDPDNQTHNLKTTPVANISDSVTVEIKMQLLKLVALNELQEVLELQYFMTCKWTDYRLHWNARDFGNIEEVIVDSSKVWTPELLLSNNAKVVEDNEITPQSNYVFISDKGICTWHPRYELSATHCSIDATWFPFDEQVCNVTFESWLLKNSTMKLKISKLKNESIILTNFRPPEGWRLKDINATTDVVPYEDNNYYFDAVVFTLRFVRKPLHYMINLIVPCGLLSFIAVIAFLLPPNCTERLGIEMTILLAMSVYQIIVSGNLPSNFDSAPIIVKYFIFLIIVCVLATALTVVVLYMYMRAESHPVAKMPARMKNLLCKILPPYLYIKEPISPPPGPPLVLKNRPSVATGDGGSSGSTDDKDATSSSHTTDELVQKMLKAICDHIDSHVHKEEEQPYDADEENEKKAWMLAAAVLDRIFAIAFAVIFCGGTFIFFVMFYSHE